MNNLSHKSVMMHAWKILENDHHNTYAFVANAFESDLLRGNSFADSAGVPQYIEIDLCSIWTFGQSVHKWKIDISNTASLEHYYDPDTGQGLNLSAYGSIEALVETAGVLGGILLGAAGFYIDVSAHPDLDFQVPYKSAADLCQEHYDKALNIWRGNAPAETGYAWADAMFHLGWACHLLADLSTSAHTTSSKFMDHTAYENEIDKYISDSGVHATNISNTLANYHIGASVRQIAIEAAQETNDELFLYDENRWEEAARLAIPRAEIYTARILAKFFYEIGISQIPAAFKINTRAINEQRIANAAVFYRNPNNSWRTIITDNNGTAKLALSSREQIQMRPAYPGYLFKGNYSGDAPTIPEFPPVQSPVSYTHAPDPLHTPSIVLRLRPQNEEPQLMQMIPLDPGMFIIKDHFRTLRPTVVEKANAEMIEVLVMGNQINTPPELKIDSPVPAHICVRVFKLVDLHTAQFVSSRNDFQHIIMNSQRMRRLQEHAGEHPENPEHELRERIRPSENILEAINRTEELNSRLSGYAGQQAVNLKYKESVINRMPVIQVNAPGRHNIEVEVVQEIGYAGYGCDGPVKLEMRTNPFEEGWFKIFAGNQAGRLKLNIAVSSVDEENVGAAEEISKTVEMWVMPKDTGEMDEDQLRAPRLETGF